MPDLQSELAKTMDKWNADDPGTESTEVADESKESTPAAKEPPKAPEEDWRKEVAAFKQGLLDERAKRQELEIRLARAEGRAEVRKPEPEPEEDDDKEFWENPQEYAKTTSDRAAKKALEEYVSSEWAQRVEWSQEKARESYADYEEKETAFFKLAEKDPALKVKVRRSFDPAEYVYRYMKKHEATSAFDPEKERERIRQEEREKLLKEKEGEQPKKKSTTLAGEQSAAVERKTLIDDDAMFAKAVRFKY